MNHFFKKHLLLTAAVVFITVPSAYADDLFDDSFFANPAPVDTAKPAASPSAETAAPAPATQPQSSPAPSPAPAEPSFSMDLPAPSAGLSVPPPPSGNASFSGFGSSGASGADMSRPPNEQILGKLSSDVFREMAEMERENNSLMLQLKREQLRSEIDALKTSNRQALFEEIERREKMTQARLEWELSQDLKRQEALERKQKAEIRQKQIEAALKREEDRRIQKMKDEELARLEKEKKLAKEEEAKKEELRKKYDAISLAQLKGLQPTLIAATRPAKIKRTASSRVSVMLTAVGEDMLSKKKAGEALTTEISVEDGKVVEAREPASSLYSVTEIRGAGGVLIAKLVYKKNKTTLFAKKSTILPTGHTVVSIDKDFVMLQIGKNKEMIGFSAAGSLSDMSSDLEDASEEDEDTAKKAPPSPPLSFSGGAFAR